MARNIMVIFCKILMKHTYKRILPLAAGTRSSTIFRLSPSILLTLHSNYVRNLANNRNVLWYLIPIDNILLI